MTASVFSAIKDWAPIVIGGAGVVGGVLAGNRADRAANQANALTQAQIDQSGRILEIGNDAGTALERAFRDYLKNIGDAGFFTTENVNDASARYYDDIMAETGMVRSAMDARRRGGYSGAEQFIEAVDAAGRPYYIPVGVSPTGGFREGNYDGLVNELSSAFLARLNAESADAIDQIMGEQSSDAIRRGLDRSTYDIETSRAAAGQVARMRNQNVLAATQAAQQFVAGRQGLDVGNQNANLAALNFDLGLEREAIQRRMGATRFGADLISGAAANDAALDAAYIQREAGIQSVVGSGAAGRAYDQALADLEATGQLRRNALSELSAIVSGPYNFRMGGSGQALQALSNAGQGATGQMNAWANMAAGAWSGAGNAFAKWVRS